MDKTSAPSLLPIPRPIGEAVSEVFPWVRHLSEADQAESAAELTDALSDAAELRIDVAAQEVIAGWRATARIKADKDPYAQALAPTEGDFGPVEAITCDRAAQTASPSRHPSRVSI